MTRILAVAFGLVLFGCNAVGQYKCRSRQSEAKVTLQEIKSAETAYFASNAKYTASTSDLHLTLSPHYYSIELSITGDGTGYKATAKGDKTETMDDEWTVDQGGTITAVHDKCHE